MGAKEARQHLVGGIVRAAGPDPFGNGVPLPTYHWGAVRALSDKLRCLFLEVATVEVLEDGCV